MKVNRGNDQWLVNWSIQVFRNTFARFYIIESKSSVFQLP